MKGWPILIIVLIFITITVSGCCCCFSNNGKSSYDQNGYDKNIGKPIGKLTYVDKNISISDNERPWLSTSPTYSYYIYPDGVFDRYISYPMGVDTGINELYSKNITLKTGTWRTIDNNDTMMILELNYGDIKEYIDYYKYVNANNIFLNDNIVLSGSILSYDPDDKHSPYSLKINNQFINSWVDTDKYIRPNNLECYTEYGFFDNQTLTKYNFSIKGDRPPKLQKGTWEKVSDSNYKLTIDDGKIENIVYYPELYPRTLLIDGEPYVVKPDGRVSPAFN